MINVLKEYFSQSLTSSDSSFKGISDITQKFFKNSLVFNRAMKIQKLIMEILRLVSMFSRFLCDNNRFIQSGMCDKRHNNQLTNLFRPYKSKN
jgi:hypothetical protein